MAGSALPESPNPHLGGKVYRFAGEGKWTDCGQVPGAIGIACLTEFKGKLIVPATPVLVIVNLIGRRLHAARLA